MEAALANRVPAGKALAVDRDRFARFITDQITNHPLIDIINQEVSTIPDRDLLILATGPLTTDTLAQDLGQLLAQGICISMMPLLQLFFGIPLIRKGLFGVPLRPWGDDYINCPLGEKEYRFFLEQLLEAEQVPLHSFEESCYFEGCLPIEIMARRGRDTLRFGPMKRWGCLIPDRQDPLCGGSTPAG